MIEREFAVHLCRLSPNEAARRVQSSRFQILLAQQRAETWWHTAPCSALSSIPGLRVRYLRAVDERLRSTSADGNMH